MRSKVIEFIVVIGGEIDNKRLIKKLSNFLDYINTTNISIKFLADDRHKEIILSSGIEDCTFFPKTNKKVSMINKYLSSSDKEYKYFRIVDWDDELQIDNYKVFENELKTIDSFVIKEKPFVKYKTGHLKKMHTTRLVNATTIFNRKKYIECFDFEKYKYDEIFMEDQYRVVAFMESIKNYKYKKIKKSLYIYDRTLPGDFLKNKHKNACKINLSEFNLKEPNIKDIIFNKVKRRINYEYIIYKRICKKRKR